MTCCPYCDGTGKRLMIARIQATVADFYRIPIQRMTSEHRDRKFCRPRQIAMFLASEDAHRSFPEIGRRFNRDHTTVIHAVRAVKERIEGDERTAEDVMLIRERLAGLDMAMAA